MEKVIETALARESKSLTWGSLGRTPKGDRMDYSERRGLTGTRAVSRGALEDDVLKRLIRRASPRVRTFTSWPTTPNLSCFSDAPLVGQSARSRARRPDLLTVFNNLDDNTRAQVCFLNLARSCTLR
jgi:hypothetical protein